MRCVQITIMLIKKLDQDYGHFLRCKTVSCIKKICIIQFEMIYSVNNLKWNPIKNSKKNKNFCNVRTTFYTRKIRFIVTVIFFV